MPPHSEVENDPFVNEETRLRKRRKRSRSTSPRHFRKTSEQREFYNNNDKCCSNRNGHASTNSSRSSSASSEVRALWLEAKTPAILATRPATPPTPAPTLAIAKPVIVGFHEAPHFLQFNPFIYSGYRTHLSTGTCIKR